MIKHFRPFNMNMLRISIICSYLLLVGTSGWASARTETAVWDPVAKQVADGPFLYVANQEAAAVTVIDLSPHTVVEIIDLEEMGY